MTKENKWLPCTSLKVVHLFKKKKKKKKKNLPESRYFAFPAIFFFFNQP